MAQNQIENLNIKPAEKLGNIAIKVAPNYARSMLFPTSLQSKIAEICDARARQGLTNYVHTIAIDQAFPEDAFLNQTLTFVKDFEESGYKITIMKKEMGETTEYKIVFFWTDFRPMSILSQLSCNKILYTTESNDENVE